MFTGEPLTFSEIHFWSQPPGPGLLGWERDLIKSLDRIFWKVQNGRRSQSSN
ncbi:hypothetical protein P9A48_gp36 [Xanthomonas phage Mallos]|uniref:Uncharacterized protein n=1 Tax=Xanthomonas phage Mallos TaxID=2939131 RepID=A0A9E7E1G5_9CAUD|nr:hypothetical protein P9A48_gp36 [Xanthomonas phage Mallos]URA07144.1 hypothetical protein Mallos_BL60036 [Xanthomonas phage Mallos]